MAQHRHFFCRRLGLSLLVVAFTLAAAELVVRLTVPEVVPARFEQDVDELQRIQLPQLAGMLQPHPELFWVLAPDRNAPASDYPFGGVVSNARGQREVRLIPYRKPAGEARVLFLGDSCTYGYGVPVADTFVQQVETGLAGGPIEHVECINTGVPVYSLFQGLRYFETEGHRYEPDVVVAALGWNDMSQWDGLGDLAHDAIRARQTPPPGLRLFADASRAAGLDSLYLDMGHSTVRGHRVVADSLVPVLRRELAP